MTLMPVKTILMVCRMAAEMGNVFPFPLQLWSTIFLMTLLQCLNLNLTEDERAARELLAGDA